MYRLYSNKSSSNGMFTREKRGEYIVNYVTTILRVAIVAYALVFAVVFVKDCMNHKEEACHPVCDRCHHEFF